MIQTNGTIKSVIINYGLLLGGLSVAFALMLFLMDMHIEQGSLQNIVGFILTVGAIVFGQLAFKKANEGFLSLGEGFKIGLGICMVGSIVGLVYGIFQMTVLDPETMTKVMEYSIDQAIQQNPELTDEMIEAIEGSIEFFTSPSMIAVFGLGSALFFGSIISLITGLALKKNKPA